jgi:hypothetical protein
MATTLALSTVHARLVGPHILQVEPAAPVCFLQTAKWCQHQSLNDEIRELEGKVLVNELHNITCGLVNFTPAI